MAEMLPNYLFKTLQQLMNHDDHGISSAAIRLSGEAGIINPQTTLVELLEHRNEVVKHIAERELLGEIKIFLGDDTPTRELLTAAHHKS